MFKLFVEGLLNSALSSKQNMQVHAGLMLAYDWRPGVNNLNPSDWNSVVLWWFLEPKQAMMLGCSVKRGHQIVLEVACGACMR